MKRMMQKGWRPLLVLILLIMAWEFSYHFFNIPDWLLPAPSSIVQEALIGWNEYAHHLLSTVQLTLIGFLIGSSVGIIVAIGLHLIPLLREAFYPLLIVSQNIPIIVSAPLLVIWFGFGMLPKVIVITLVCFFPITIATLDGFQQTSRELKHYMLMVGATKQQFFGSWNGHMLYHPFFQALKSRLHIV